MQVKDTGHSTNTRTSKRNTQRCADSIDDVAVVSGGKADKTEMKQVFKGKKLLSSPSGKVGSVPSRSQAQGNTVGLP